MPKLTVKCSDAELVVWRESAWEARVTLSEWVRRALDDRAANGGGPMATAMRGLTEEQLGRGLVAGEPASEETGRESSASPSIVAVAQGTAGPSLTEPSSAPAASPCKRAHLHHTNHGGKPCPDCGFPNV